MVARSFDSLDRNVQGVHAVASSRARSRRHPLRHRLVVITPNTADAVRCAGGWLFDRVMAGWHVTVLVADRIDDADPRPLRILGVEVLELESALTEGGEYGPMPRGIAVAADLCESDARVRRGLLDILDQHASEVTLWGQRCPAGLDRRVGSVQHQLSVAAKAFKAQALAAVETPVDSIGDIESFRSSERLLWPCGPDLIPAS